MVIFGPLSRSRLTMWVCPTRAHSCRICRTGTLSAMTVTRPLCIVSFNSPADAGSDTPATTAARNTQHRTNFFMGVPASIRLLRRRIELGGRLDSDELGNPERRVLARQIARPAHVRAAALEVLSPDSAVEIRVPDLLD